VVAELEKSAKLKKKVVEDVVDAPVEDPAPDAERPASFAERYGKRGAVYRS
jgi:hypothetical protein